MKRPRVSAKCCKCNADIMAANNRTQSTMCESCRIEHVAHYKADYGKLRRSDEYKGKQRIRIVDLALCPVCFNPVLCCVCPTDIEPAPIDIRALIQPKGSQWRIEPYYWQQQGVTS